MASGGALLVGGGVVNFLVVEPAWAEIEAANERPRSVTRAEAEDILARFDGSRYATLGLLAAGVASAGAGIVVTAVDARVVLSPMGVTIAGTW